MNSVILERNAKIGEAGKATRLRRKSQVCKVYKRTQIEEEIRRATSSYRISKLLSVCEGATL